MTVDVYIKGQRVDLYADENISVTQSTQDVKDISKVFGDYSQTFNVPASKRNNEIFKYFYNADIDNGFDARLRVEGSISVNTLDFKRGKIRLDGAEVENNEPKNYKITFFGNIVNIKDKIGDDKLNELEWLDNFNHDYSGDIVKDGLINGLDFTVDSIDYDKAVIYPLIGYKRQFYYNSVSSDHTNTDQLVNIHYHTGHSGNEHGVEFSELKPAIKLFLIIKAIEKKYDFIFTSGFFESQVFKNIYVNLNKTTESLANGYYKVEDITTDTPVETSASNDLVRYYGTITPKAGFTNVQYKIRLSMNGDIVYESSGWLTGTKTKTGQLDNPTGTAKCVLEVITQEDFDFDANTDLKFFEFGVSSGSLGDYPNAYTDLSIDLVTNILNEFPDIKVYEFLTNIFKTFNLTATSNGDEIIIEDLPSWYSDGNIYDITPYVDLAKENVDRGKIYREINFKFKDSEQIIADEFKQSNNSVYGNLEFKLTDVDGQDLESVDGEVLNVESIFENPIYERLNDLNGNLETTIQYCPYFNRSIESISGNMFMFYAPLVSLSANPIGFLTLSAYSQINSRCFMPSHSIEMNYPSFNLNFNAEINEYSSQVYQDTIYKRFYDDYIIDMFSVKRRIFKFKAILPDFILNKLKLNDRVIIKDRRYIINKLTSNLTKREDTFELINDIYNAPLQSDVLTNSVLRSSGANYGSSERTDSLQYIGVKDAVASKIDLGDGTSWVSINSFGKLSLATLTFTISANTSGLARNMRIKITDGINNPNYLITQEA